MTWTRRQWLNRGLCVWAVVAAALVLWPWQSDAKQPDAGKQVDDATASGKTLYETGCASCHGLLGQGSDDAPPIVNIGDAAVDFMLRTGRMPAAFPQNEAAIAGTPKYSDDERARIVGYVASLGSPASQGPAIPAIDPAAGDLQRGRRLFLDNCAACHGIAATGDAVGEDSIAPSLHNLDPVVIGEAPLFGPGVMPRFDDVLDTDDLNSIVRYVQYTQSGPDEHAGGVTMNDTGPVMEGLVAVVLGLGVIIGIARIIESVKREEPA